MLPRFRGASTKRWKDAGRVASGTSGATEDAPARSVIARRKPGGHYREGHYAAAGRSFVRRALIARIRCWSRAQAQGSTSR